MNTVYLRLELLRLVRNRRASVFSLIFPIVMYVLLAAPNKDDHNFGGSDTVHTGLFAPQYYMVGLLAFGAMIAVLSSGARIAAERKIGWNRQLRLTPLSPRTYLRTKILTGYLLAIVSMVLLYVAGFALGVRIDAPAWLEMTALVLIGLVPFAALGVALGHLMTDDSVGPALGGITSLFAFLGGTWFPITGDGFFTQFCRSLPSYWLTQAGRVGLSGTGDPWGARGWLTIAVWTVVMVAVAAWAYRRDTARG